MCSNLQTCIINGLTHTATVGAQWGLLIDSRELKSCAEEMSRPSQLDSAYHTQHAVVKVVIIE